MPDEKFEYAYSAPTEKERKEIESILREYTPERRATADKLSRLRSLDKKVKLPPTLIAWATGIVGLLTFGGGFSLVIEYAMYIWGSLIAAAGGALIVIAFPLYKLILMRRKAKYGDEILALSQELLSIDENQNTAL